MSARIWSCALVASLSLFVVPSLHAQPKVDPLQELVKSLQKEGKAKAELATALEELLKKDAETRRQVSGAQ